MGQSDITQVEDTHISVWRQGHVLCQRNPALEELSSIGADGLAIVVSTDCDVATTDFEKEPLVELLVARPAKKEDGNLRHGKNPRRLQLELEVTSGTGTRLYEAHINDRFRVNRRPLASKMPDADHRIPQNELRTLQRWLAKRYFRAAFPDTFNSRLAPAVQGIRKVLRTGGSLIESIWLGLDTLDELPAGTDYEIQVFAVMTVDNFRNADSRDAGHRCFDAVLAEMEGCDGLVVSNEGLLPEDQLTLADMRVLSRWDWDDLTLRDPDQEEPWAET